MRFHSKLTWTMYPIWVFVSLDKIKNCYFSAIGAQSPQNWKRREGVRT